MIALQVFSLATAWIAISIAVGCVVGLVLVGIELDDDDHEDLLKHEAERRAMARTVDRCRSHRSSTTHHHEHGAMPR
ncbi:MAG: hypothetical protein H0W25_05530 [Acidimicrobiia bacterium]|nr:hypothetical protein [Acidimicrobiia bacterium]